MKKISIREFNRRMYHYINKLPVIVQNLKTGEDLFIVKKIGGVDNEIRTKDTGKQDRS